MKFKFLTALQKLETISKISLLEDLRNVVLTVSTDFESSAVKIEREIGFLEEAVLPILPHVCQFKDNPRQP